MPIVRTLPYLNVLDTDNLGQLVDVGDVVDTGTFDIPLNDNSCYLLTVRVINGNQTNRLNAIVNTGSSGGFITVLESNNLSVAMKGSTSDVTVTNSTGSTRNLGYTLICLFDPQFT